MKYLKAIFLVSTLFYLSSCSSSQVDDACIESPNFMFFDIENRLASCSGNDDYVLWEFEGSDAKLGRTISHKFVKSGSQILKQTVYSDDARNSSTQELSVDVGFIQIDSVVVDFINTNGVVFEPRPDIYMVVAGGRSNETYENTVDSSVPRTYTFTNDSRTGSNIFSLEFIDFNEGQDDQPVINESIELSLETFSNPIIAGTRIEKYECKIYWSFVLEL